MKRIISIIFCIFGCATLYSQNTRTLLKNAEKLYSAGNYYESCIQLNELITLEPENIRALMDRSAVLFALQQYQKALEDINFVIKLVPGSVKAYHFRATIYEALKMFDEAIADEKRVLEKVPDYMPGLNLAGYISLEQEQYNQSLEYFNKLILIAEKSNIKSDIYYLNRGYLFFAIGEFNNALDDVAQAININYQNIDALVLKALIYREINNLDDAMTLINNAVSLRPDEIELVYVKIILQFDMNKIQDAKKEIDFLKERGINSAEYHALLGAYYTLEGDLNSAEMEVAEYRKLESANPLFIKLFVEKKYFE